LLHSGLGFSGLAWLFFWDCLALNQDGLIDMLLCWLNIFALYILRLLILLLFSFDTFFSIGFILPLISTAVSTIFSDQVPKVSGLQWLFVSLNGIIHEAFSASQQRHSFFRHHSASLSDHMENVSTEHNDYHSCNYHNNDEKNLICF
jgi:hypothetical protein